MTFSVKVQYSSAILKNEGIGEPIDSNDQRIMWVTGGDGIHTHFPIPVWTEAIQRGYLPFSYQVGKYISATTEFSNSEARQSPLMIPIDPSWADKTDDIVETFRIVYKAPTHKFGIHINQVALVDTTGGTVDLSKYPDPNLVTHVFLNGATTPLHLPTDILVDVNSTITLQTVCEKGMANNPPGPLDPDSWEEWLHELDYYRNHTSSGTSMDRILTGSHLSDSLFKFDHAVSDMYGSFLTYQNVNISGARRVTFAYRFWTTDIQTTIRYQLWVMMYQRPKIGGYYTASPRSNIWYSPLNVSQLKKITNEGNNLSDVGITLDGAANPNLSVYTNPSWPNFDTVDVTISNFDSWDSNCFISVWSNTIYGAGGADWIRMEAHAELKDLKFYDAEGNPITPQPVYTANKYSPGGYITPWDNEWIPFLSWHQEKMNRTMDTLQVSLINSDFEITPIVNPYSANDTKKIDVLANYPLGGDAYTTTGEVIVTNTDPVNSTTATVYATDGNGSKTVVDSAVIDPNSSHTFVLNGDTLSKLLTPGELHLIQSLNLEFQGNVLSKWITWVTKSFETRLKEIGKPRPYDFTPSQASIGPNGEQWAAYEINSPSQPFPAIDGKSTSSVTFVVSAIPDQSNQNPRYVKRVALKVDDTYQLKEVPFTPLTPDGAAGKVSFVLNYNEMRSDGRFTYIVVTTSNSP